MASNPGTSDVEDHDDYLHWNTDRVVIFLKDKQVPNEVVEKFVEQNITGRCLKDVDEKKLKEMTEDIKEGYKERTAAERLSIMKKTTADRLWTMKAIKDLLKSDRNPDQTLIGPLYHSKVFNDSIHGHIVMHPLAVAIIDTAQFQRLRWIKQLGVAYMVYPGASHNRFEHSLGVAHLAGEFARVLRKNQPELNITDEDVVCLELAGLCHDLGHGPFSHLFDNDFLPKIYPDPDEKWKHEVASLQMLHYMFDSNDLIEKFLQYDLDEKDLTFVEECINGPQGPEGTYIGRPDKPFLYEIVANKETWVDVDKWDYFARDCHHLGVKSTFDHKRYMLFARVIQGKICCRDKEVHNLYNMFRSRADLHIMAYQHKTVQILGSMLVQALVKANKHILITGKDGREYKIADTVEDMEAYCKLTDNIFLDILNSSSIELKPSRELLHDMQKRRMFRYIGETEPSRVIKPDERREYIIQIAELCKETNAQVVWEEELICQVASFDLGKEGKNPVDTMNFYSKADPYKSTTIPKTSVSLMLPLNFSECRFRLFCKSPHTSVHKIAADCFKVWCKENQFSVPKIFTDGVQK